MRRVTRFFSGIYSLLLLTPLAFAASFIRWHAALTWLLNFLVIIPLSSLISDASDKLGPCWGPLVGGLLNATFGNTVELMVGIFAVLHGEIALAQAMMLGSIMSDILLVLGICLIAAARSSETLSFNVAAANTLSSLMTIAAMALILPTMLYASFPTHSIDSTILSFSRITAAVLLIVYVAYLNFQIRTHSYLFEGEGEDEDEDALQVRHPPTSNDSDQTSESTDGESHGAGDNVSSDEGRQEASPLLGQHEVYRLVTVLLICSLLIGACTQNMLEVLEDTASSLGVTKIFFAVAILPLASNAAEISSVYESARKHHINTAIGVIVGSILQIALFVLPALVFVGYFAGRPMTLYFETSQTCLLFLTVLLVNLVLKDIKYTYLTGTQMIVL
ncbi:vacuolar calcium ion transporter [Thozetella sp. PMI_491]|nr:vacuolar calcium ion transporter [Thozetella sp. PMI_491]